MSHCFLPARHCNVAASRTPRTHPGQAPENRLELRYRPASGAQGMPNANPNAASAVIASLPQGYRDHGTDHSFKKWGVQRCFKKMGCSKIGHSKMLAPLEVLCLHCRGSKASTAPQAPACCYGCDGCVRDGVGDRGWVCVELRAASYFYTGSYPGSVVRIP